MISIIFCTEKLFIKFVTDRLQEGMFWVDQSQKRQSCVILKPMEMGHLSQRETNKAYT